MVIGIMMEHFRWKAGLIAGGNMTEPSLMQVCHHETVHIVLMIVTLNDLEVKSMNILNAYLVAPVMKKVWTMLGVQNFVRMLAT